MINKVNLTKNSTEAAQKLLQQLSLRPNITSRNALLFSLNKKDKYNPKDKIQNNGMEIKTQTLFGEEIDIYFMLLKEYYGDLDKYNLEKLISFHVDEAFKNKEFINTLKNLV